MPRYTGRVTHRDEVDEAVTLGKLKKIVEWTGGSYLIVREEAEHVHWHFALVTEKDARQIRNCATRMEFSGNRRFSLKDALADEAWAAGLRYLCKGSASHPDPQGDPPQVAASYGTWDVAGYHAAYWQQSVEVKQNKSLSFTDQVLFRLTAAGVNPADVTPREVVRQVVEISIEQKRVLNDHYVMGVSRMVIAKLNKEYREEYIEQCARRLSTA